MTLIERNGNKMKVTMNDEALAEKKRRLNWIRTILALLFGIVPLITFFFPYVTYQFGAETFKASAWQLISTKGFWVQGTILPIPMVARIGLIAGALFALCGTISLLIRKAILSGLCFTLTALTPIIVLLSSSEIQTAVTELNISKVSIEYLLPFTMTLILGLLAAVMAVWTTGGEKLAESIFLVFACVSVGSVLIITIYMIGSGTPAIAEIGLFDFLFGTTWKPSEGLFGILPMILASIAGTIGAILLGVPIGILTAAFLAETAPQKLANMVRPAVQLLAGIPSVIYGFFGMLIIVPFIRSVFPGQTIGDSLLAVILILAIMVLPTIVSITETSLRAVPQSYREAALALGTTPIKTIFKVTIPAAKSGILSGVILGVGRAIGETMAVIMVAGNVVNMPSILGTVRLLTTGIVLEMSYSSGLHRQALFAIGLILFIFIMVVNISFTVISKKGAQMDAN